MELDSVENSEDFIKAFQAEFGEEFSKVLQNEDFQKFTEEVRIPVSSKDLKRMPDYLTSLEGEIFIEKLILRSRIFGILCMTLAEVSDYVKGYIKENSLVNFKYLKVLKNFTLFDNTIDDFTCNLKQDTHVLSVAADPGELDLTKAIIKCAFFLNAYARERDFPCAYGFCTNFKYFRFVKYHKQSHKITLSKPVKLMEDLRNVKTLNKENLQNVVDSIRGLVLRGYTTDPEFITPNGDS